MRNLFLAIACSLLLNSAGIAQSAKDIIAATDSFVATLKPEQVKAMMYPFDDTLRTKWTNLPVGLEKRPGLRYGDLSEESRFKFHPILLTLLSSQGYLKTTSIMRLDDILNELYQTLADRKLITANVLNDIHKLDWDFGNYYISLWGKPGPIEPWGFKFEGHHISINLTATGEKISLTPLFLGTDPAHVPVTKYAGLRVLSKEEDYGFRLLHSFTPEQKTKAILSRQVPGDIITNPAFKDRITAFYGIPGSEMTEKQQAILSWIIKEYINNLEHEESEAALNKLKTSGMTKIYFAWIGSYEPNQPHYYIIHSPDFVIEYDNVGFQNDGNHIHTIWRETANDFGEDLLKEHYQMHKH